MTKEKQIFYGNQGPTKNKKNLDPQEKNLAPQEEKPKEIDGPKGLEPTRYGDWEKKGRCCDF
jgi:hypothetical protein